jgi:hypothetical protein
VPQAKFSLGVVLFICVCGLSASAHAQDSPTYCHEYCVEQNQCNPEFSCYDAGTQSWTNCYDYNYSAYCSGLSCDVQWGAWTFDHWVGEWAVNDFFANTCMMYESYVITRDGENPCTHQQYNEQSCQTDPIPTHTGEAGTCCAVWGCWGAACFEQ